MVALFRFGVAVMVGLSPLEEEDALARLKSRVYGERAKGDDEYVVLEIAPESDEQKSCRRPDPDQEPVAAALPSWSPTRSPRPWRSPATSARSTRCST